MTHPRSIASLLVTTALALAACGGSSKKAPEPAPVAGGSGGAAAPAPADPVPPAAHGACVDTGAPQPDMTMEEAEQRGLAAMEGMAALMEANAKDCAKLAAALRDWTRANCALLLQMQQFAARQTPEAKAAFDKKFGDKMTELGARMMPAFQNCGGDPGVQAAM